MTTKFLRKSMAKLRISDSENGNACATSHIENGSSTEVHFNDEASSQQSKAIGKDVHHDTTLKYLPGSESR